MKRFSIMALVIAILLASFSSCNGEETTLENDQTDGTEQTEMVETEAASPWESLEKKDYGGYTFQTLASDSAILNMFLSADEETGEILNDTVFRRNTSVEDLYHVQVATTVGGDAATVRNMMMNDVVSGSGEFDITFQWASHLPTLAIEGTLYDIMQIDEIDTASPWWNQSYVNSFQLVPGKLYYGSNAIFINNLTSAGGIFFNSDLVEEYALDDPYVLVENGTWTLDAMYGMMETVMGNLDGSDTRSPEDMYGMTFAIGNIMYVYSACDVFLAEMDENDKLVITYTGEKEGQVADWLYKVLSDKAMVADMNNDAWAFGMDNGSMIAPVFNAGHCLFYPGSIWGMQYLRNNMEYNFGVLPGPKFDENQAEYRSCCGGLNTGLFAISSLQEDPSRTGNIVEALSIYSYEYLIEAYIDINLGGKVARDEETRTMLEIILNSTVFDPGLMLFSSVWDSFYPAVKKAGGSELASTAASVREKVETEFNTLYDGMNNIS